LRRFPRSSCSQVRLISWKPASLWNTGASFVCIVAWARRRCPGVA
jgi:hypothetical protein